MLKSMIHNQRNKQFTTKITNIVSLRKLFSVLAILVLLLSPIMVYTQSSADEYDEKINALTQQNEKKSDSLNQLGSQADSLEEAISKLQKQINALQSQISDNKSKIANLENEIRKAKKELAEQKDLLGENIRQMYLEGDISTLEMLASSKDLSEFVDKQQYRNSVQSKITDTLEKINTLKDKLSNQKVALDNTVKDLEARQSTIDDKKSEQNAILSLNQAQQSNLNSQIKNNSKKIAQLRAEQAAANAVLFGGNVPTGSAANCGGYPAVWCHAPIDSIIDTWGMYNRECVSYTAWKVWSVGKHMPYWGGRGNANQWDDNARAAGIPVNNNPNGVGVVAISNSGYYGHSMYVEHVYGDGTILVSQYNAGWDGYYSTARISTAGLVFIHF